MMSVGHGLMMSVGHGFLFKGYYMKIITQNKIMSFRRPTSHQIMACLRPALNQARARLLPTLDQVRMRPTLIRIKECPCSTPSWVVTRPRQPHVGSGTRLYPTPYWAMVRPRPTPCQVRDTFTKNSTSGYCVPIPDHSWVQSKANPILFGFSV